MNKLFNEMNEQVEVIQITTLSNYSISASRINRLCDEMVSRHGWSTNIEVRVSPLVDRLLSRNSLRYIVVSDSSILDKHLGGDLISSDIYIYDPEQLEVE